MRASDLLHSYEQLHEGLLYLAASPRNQLQNIDAWIDSLIRNDALLPARSYLRELYSVLESAAGSASPIGCAPELFASLIEKIGTIETSLPDLLSRERTEHLLHLLAGHEAAVHAFLGKSDRSQQPEIGEQWERAIRSEPDALHVPLIERDLFPASGYDFHPFGSIVPLRIAASLRPAKVEGDIIQIANNSDPAGVAEMEQAVRSALDAARALYADYINAPSVPPLMITPTYEHAGNQYTGRSLGLGAGVLAFCLLSQRSYDRKYFVPGGDAVFTGMLNSNGVVGALEDEQVRRKVETVFYSPYTRLVLPKENERAAEETLAALRERHPSRRLEIAPVRYLRDAVNHRQAVVQRAFTARERTVRVAKRYQTGIAIAASALVVLLLGLYFLVIADFDDNPATYKISNNRFNIVNKRDKSLWQFPVGSDRRPFENERLRSCFDEGYLTKFAAVYDLDGDGRKEVVLGHPITEKEYSNYLFYYDSWGHEKWRKRIGYPVETRENKYKCDDLRLLTVWAGTVTQFPKPVIVASFCDDYYSCFVVLFDSDMNLKGQYYHLGPLFDLQVFMDSATGTSRILLTGAHNGFRSAVAVILDPGRISGRSPQESSHEVISPPHVPGTEERYIVFPKSDVNRLLGNSPIPRAGFGVPPAGSICIELYETRLPESMLSKGLHYAKLLYYFDARFNPVVCRTSSEFDYLTRQLVENGKLSEQTAIETPARLLDQIRFWNGDSLVHRVTRNRYYTSAVSIH